VDSIITNIYLFHSSAFCNYLLCQVVATTVPPNVKQLRSNKWSFLLYNYIMSAFTSINISSLCLQWLCPAAVIMFVRMRHYTVYSAILPYISDQTWLIGCSWCMMTSRMYADHVCLQCLSLCRAWAGNIGGGRCYSLSLEPWVIRRFKWLINSITFSFINIFRKVYTLCPKNNPHLVLYCILLYYSWKSAKWKMIINIYVCNIRSVKHLIILKMSICLTWHNWYIRNYKNNDAITQRHFNSVMYI